MLRYTSVPGSLLHSLTTRSVQDASTFSVMNSNDFSVHKLLDVDCRNYYIISMDLVQYIITPTYGTPPVFV